MANSIEDSKQKFVEDLSEYLKNNKLKETLDLFNCENHDSIIKEASWNIVPIVASYITMENMGCNRQLIDVCETILDIIVELCNPSETVLLLLEQVEYQEDDLKFCMILKPLSKSLSKMPDKTKSIGWCVGTIRSYIEGLPIPQVEKFEEEEKNRPRNVKEKEDRIINVYNAILTFLDTLVEEAALEHDNSDTFDILRDYLASILIFLLGKPLCYLKVESLSTKIIMQILRVNGDLLSFLEIVKTRSETTLSKKMISIDEKPCNLQVALFESIDNVPNLSYANFYFHILTVSSLWKHVPQIYHPRYMFGSCIYLINSLLQEQEVVIIAKGLTFMEHLLKIMEKRILPVESLDRGMYLGLFDTMMKVMIYCSGNKERKAALHVFQEYIEMFKMDARYFIISHLYEVSEHSGLLSLTTGILKASIMECLETTPSCPYFFGTRLHSLIWQACKLPHGSGSDLVELSDEIITSLNLLRFLFIKDKSNKTGIWNIADKLYTDYLKPLREGIDLCRAHWNVKIKDLEEQRKTQTKTYDDCELERRDTEVTLIVGGEKLPTMPVTQKITFCHQAVNGLDVMECILIRVNECIANNPLKKQ